MTKRKRLVTYLEQANEQAKRFREEGKPELYAYTHRGINDALDMMEGKPPEVKTDERQDHSDS